MYIENTKKLIWVILQGNVGFKFVINKKEVFIEFVDFKGIDTHAYALLLIEWQLWCAFVRSKMVDLSLFLQITALHIFHAALAACFFFFFSLSLLANNCCVLVFLKYIKMFLCILHVLVRRISCGLWKFMATCHSFQTALLQLLRLRIEWPFIQSLTGCQSHSTWHS